MSQILKKDVVFKKFWRDNERFADLFNGVVFGGCRIVEADSLSEGDTDVSESIELKGSAETLVRTRDVIKKCAYGIEFVILGLELQEKVHYAMPLRSMLYDGLSYLKEYHSFAKEFRGQGTADEFLSKMKKEDRLHPVITLVVYCGEYGWDGPRCLKDMMAEMPEEIAEVFSDYKMNLFAIRDSGKYRFQNKDVQVALDFTEHIFKGDIESVMHKYAHTMMNKDVRSFIGAMTDISKLFVGNEKEDGNMCEALDRYIKEKAEVSLSRGRAEGHAAGKQEAQREFIQNMYKNGMSYDVIAQAVGFPLEKVLALADSCEKKYEN